MQKVMNGQQSQKSANNLSKLDIFFVAYTAIFFVMMFYHLCIMPENLAGDRQIAIDAMCLFPSLVWAMSNSSKKPSHE